ncbi:peptidase M22 [Mycoplasma simbae]|uniref:peptidase M22 n=1 Tax=Mycoplasma simbae TaxID=36744 RepID=UPI0004983432|nr:peptidase M22 [Mycoplasma simbae]
MKLFLDTSNEYFVIAAFDDNYNKLASYIVKEAKKVPLIVGYTEKICKDLNININQFNEFYTNLGPGMFTGVRISLVFLRTIALLNQPSIKTISSMQILKHQYPNKNEFRINASGNKHYYWCDENTEFTIEKVKVLTNESANFDIINYDDLLNNFAKFAPLFKQHDNLMQISPYYIKAPQIGEKK